MKRAKSVKQEDNSFVYRLIELQANVKIYHWMTFSYSKHKVSDKFYTKLSDKIDKFVEAYIGIYGRPVLNANAVTMHSMKDDEMMAYLVGTRKYLMKELPISYENDGDLTSILDDILSLINKTLYLFTMS